MCLVMQRKAALFYVDRNYITQTNGFMLKD